MLTPGPPSASAELRINADANAVYALVTDLPTLAALADETEAMEWMKGDTARPGAVFKGHNRNGRHRWSTTCTVTDAEPGRMFAFDVRYVFLPVAHWQYDIAPQADQGCRVTESTWDLRPGWLRRMSKSATGVADRQAANTEHIRATLERIKQRAEPVSTD